MLLLAALTAVSTYYFVIFNCEVVKQIKAPDIKQAPEKVSSLWPIKSIFYNESSAVPITKIGFLKTHKVISLHCI